MSKRKKSPQGERSGADDPVGKGRPPRHTQWKPGQSGNKAGRKKGAKNRKTIVRSAERKTFTVTKGARKRKMTCTELGLEFLQQDVARGDRKAFIEYPAILERYSDRDETSTSMKDLLADDAAILVNLRARMKRKVGPKGDK